MGATRLPGKVLADIAGRPMLWHVVTRVRRARLIDHVMVATSTNSADDVVAAFCAEQGIECFRGSESDVLARYDGAARQAAADVVVRVTADCPMIDAEVVDAVVRAYLDGACDYVTNTLRATYPDGLDVEVFSFAALARAARNARRATEREHVTAFFRTSAEFRVGGVEYDGPSLAAFRWTVDEAADLDFARQVFHRLGGAEAVFGLRDVLALIEENPELAKINGQFVRNEGYYRSLAREAPMSTQDRSLRRSLELKAKARTLIPSITQTFSKGPTQFVQGVAPVFIERGEGSHVWDVDGNEYIDYPMALGAVILGHHDPVVSDAVTRQLARGAVHSLPHPLELEVAEQLVEVIPSAEMVRFGKNGSDATSGAVRVARAYTGRDVIACCGYHGWQDWYIGTTTRNRGVPKAVQELTVPFEYNDIASLERIFAEHPGRVAAVIMEPVGVVPPREGFLRAVQDRCRREGALLVFDEIVTGFRLALGGAQQLFEVTPDLACYGKAMANGFPIAAVVGRRDVMELFDEVFFSFTFGGETLSLAAAKATMTRLLEQDVVGHLWGIGRRLQDGYNVLARDAGLARYTECIGLPPRTVMTFKDAAGAESLVFKSLFQQECLKRGVLFSGGQNVCFSHRDAEVEQTLRVYRAAMDVLALAVQKGDALERLEGPPVEPVFRRA